MPDTNNLKTFPNDENEVPHNKQRQLNIVNSGKGKDAYLNKHKRFINYTKSYKGVSHQTNKRSIAITSDSVDGINLLHKVPYTILADKLPLSAEAVAFLFNLDGCPKNLLFFILQYELDFKTGIFIYNQLTIEHFKEFCLLFGCEYSEGTVKQAKKTLNEFNTIQNESTGVYRVNPLLFVCDGSTKRKLINEYSLLLHKKPKKDEVLDFYPCFDRS